MRGPPGPRVKEGPAGPKCGGVAYIRWGKSTCPTGTGREKAYSGISVGENFAYTGGGENYLCMPKDPEYILPHRVDSNFIGSYLHGVEYKSPVQVAITTMLPVQSAMCPLDPDTS